MKLSTISNGGFLKDKKILLSAIVGIISAITAWAIGDMNLDLMISTVASLCGVIFFKKKISSTFSVFNPNKTTAKGTK
ncbi:MAG: hypothetical protein JJV93_02755 [Alphaproteobacteria bacterium]|nr:hypothetical protein [Alphaproteobacteria bacterium]MBL0718149.1 hypothetical protein [Alphaproteobacteria bacterium]